MKSNDPQIEAEKHRLQMEMLLKDGDLKKNLRKKMELEVEIRQLKVKRNQIESEYALAESQLKRIEMELIGIQNELIKFKHKMLTLN